MIILPEFLECVPAWFSIWNRIRFDPAPACELIEVLTRVNREVCRVDDVSGHLDTLRSQTNIILRLMTWMMLLRYFRLWLIVKYRVGMQETNVSDSILKKNEDLLEHDTVNEVELRKCFWQVRNYLPVWRQRWWWMKSSREWEELPLTPSTTSPDHSSPSTHWCTSLCSWGWDWWRWCEHHHPAPHMWETLLWSHHQSPMRPDSLVYCTVPSSDLLF